jgi:hypothetical protein
MMTDITNIKYYLEWRAEHEGRMIDVSPEAWIVDVHSEAVLDAFHDYVTSDYSETHVVDAVRDFYEVCREKEALND